MVKVCHMTSAHGVEDVRIFHKECLSLAQAGYEVYLIERGDSYDKDGVHIVGIGEIPQSRLKRIINGARKAYKKALLLDCDLYHIHDPELIPYGLKLKRRGKKVIFDSHELTREQIRIKPYLPKAVANVLSVLYATYENKIISKIDGVIFPCPIGGKFPIPGKKQVYINNLPRLSEMYDRYDPSYKKIPNSICTVGSLTYGRGIKHLILAASRANCKVFLGGRLSPFEFEKEIKSMAESHNVELLGNLNREEVIDVYNRSQICSSALLNVGQYSEVENLSTKVYESMAMGLPVIITKQPYNEKMVEKYQFGMCVDPENVEEYANAIRELLIDPIRMKTLGENGRKAIKEDLNWEKEQNKLLKLYKEVLDK